MIFFVSDIITLRMSKQDGNIFDLRKLIPGGVKKSEPYVHKYTAVVDSDSEKRSLLENYAEVEEGGWDKIRVGTHVRYENKDGEFKRGGFVANHYVSNKEETKGHKMIRLRSTPAKGGKEWSIDATSKVAQMWKNGKFEPKQDAAAIIGGLRKTTESLAAQIEQLRIELSHLSNEQKRTIALIKKLHNIQV